MKNFQIIILIVFIVAAIVGVLAFSGALPIGGSGNKAGSGGTVVIWGTAKASNISKALDDFNRVNTAYTVKYVQKQPESFNQDLLEALASGKGPDLFFISDDLVHEYSDKIFTIPYKSFPLSVFNSDFAGAGSIFLSSQGILAFPIAIDPLMMYYNRSILNANGVVYPPTYWDELPALSTTLSKKDDSGQIKQSAFGLGQFSNINNAKDILSALFMQAGNPIVAQNSGVFVSTLNQSSNLSQVLASYTDFADPLKAVYSWNKSLPNSQNAFSAENLAFYFGLGSEEKILSEKNPNENFGIAPLPQIRGASFKLTSGRITGVAVSAFSKNLNSAFMVADLLATGDFAKEYDSAENLAPARRNLLASPAPNDPYQSLIYSSALYAKSWLDPSPVDTDKVFKDMVENVLSGNFTPEAAINDASAKLNVLLSK